MNIISEPFIEGANSTSVDAPEDVSEWPISGLTKEKSVSSVPTYSWVKRKRLMNAPVQIHAKPARVKESAFSLECEVCAGPRVTIIVLIVLIRPSSPSSQLYQAIDIIDPASGAQTTTLILGHVKYIHVRKDVLNERGNVDPGKLKPVARLGDISYVRIGDGFRIARPVWANEQDKIRMAVEDQGDGTGKL